MAPCPNYDLMAVRLSGYAEQVTMYASLEKFSCDLHQKLLSVNAVAIVEQHIVHVIFCR